MKLLWIMHILSQFKCKEFWGRPLPDVLSRFAENQKQRIIPNLLNTIRFSLILGLTWLVGKLTHTMYFWWLNYRKKCVQVSCPAQLLNNISSLFWMPAWEFTFWFLALYSINRYKKLQNKRPKMIAKISKQILQKTWFYMYFIIIYKHTPTLTMSKWIYSVCVKVRACICKKFQGLRFSHCVTIVIIIR
jgi:hypothetical protein